MNDKFDELVKGLAQSVTRKQALKKLGAGIAGIALATLGLANKAEAGPDRCRCNGYPYGCPDLYPLNSQAFYDCLSYCSAVCAEKPKKHGGWH